MTPSVRSFTLEDTIFVLTEMTVTHREHWLTSPITAPLLPLADAQLQALVGARATTAARPQGDPEAANRADRVAEAAVRCVYLAYDLAAALAMARGDEALSVSLEGAQRDVFSDGLAFVRLARAQQVGATHRVLELAAPDTGALFDDARFVDASFAELLDLLRQRNEELAAHLRPPPVVAQEAAGPAPLTAVQARNAAVAFLSDVLPVIARAFPDGDPKAVARREQLLGPIRQRAEALRPRVPKAPPVSPAPTAAPPEPEPVA